MNMLKARCKRFTKGESVVFVSIDLIDREGRLTVDGQGAKFYRVSMGGAHGSVDYNLDEGEYAVKMFNARCHELLDRDYEVRNCVRKQNGDFTTWGVED